MDENDFEGSIILEQLAALNLVDDFFEAVDSDNLTLMIKILRKADIDDEAIRSVIQKIQEE